MYVVCIILGLLPLRVDGDGREEDVLLAVLVVLDVVHLDGLADI